MINLGFFLRFFVNRVPGQLLVCGPCQVNGRDMRRVSHRDAVKSLVAPNDEVVVEVSHDPQPLGLQVSLAVSTN